MVQTITEKIKQRRRQMLVHSYIYYEKNMNIISDAKWSEWAMELVDLQKKYPKESRSAEYFDLFKGWDGSSGAFLKFPDNIRTVAERLLQRTDSVPKPVKKAKVEPKRKKKINARKLF